MNTNGPLIIQSDYTLLLEVQHPDYPACRDFLGSFAEMVKSPEFVHTYRITPLSLWNAASLGYPLRSMMNGLRQYSRYDLPVNVLSSMEEWYATYGKLVLQHDSDGLLRLEICDPVILNRLQYEDSIKPYWQSATDNGFLIPEQHRGIVKQVLIDLGYPVKDLCGYVDGHAFAIKLRDVDLEGNVFRLRDYQVDAAEAFHQSGSKMGGSGVIVLPCGSGKTVIGIGVMAAVSAHTLIIATNNVAVHQWQDEIVSKTHVSPDDIGEYTGLAKQIRPITVTTYQMLTYRRSRDAPFPNLRLFTSSNWGLIVYDEVHMLPAPVFRKTTEIQARRRLGLTATLIREDGKEDDVFALIGPQRYHLPWKSLENRGYIAEAFCNECRIFLSPEEELNYAAAPKRYRFRIAAENSRKLGVVRQLLANHRRESVLVIGHYISQLKKLAAELELPLITGKTPNVERERLYGLFKAGKTKTLVVSKVANFAVDLPDANVLIQVSGTFGSRQEEAQRLGRILRPKKQRSIFYTLVSKGTDEQKFGMKRQLFLVEQGYRYAIHNLD